MKRFLCPPLLTFAIGHIVVCWSRPPCRCSLTFTTRPCPSRTRTRQTPRWLSGDRLDLSTHTYDLSSNSNNLNVIQKTQYIRPLFQLHPVLSDRGAGRAEKPEARAEGPCRQEGRRGDQDEEVGRRKTRGWVEKWYMSLSCCIAAFSMPKKHFDRLVER